MIRNDLIVLGAPVRGKFLCRIPQLGEVVELSAPAPSGMPPLTNPPIHGIPCVGVAPLPGCSAAGHGLEVYLVMSMSFSDQLLTPLPRHNVR